MGGNCGKKKEQGTLWLEEREGGPQCVVHNQLASAQHNWITRQEAAKIIARMVKGEEVETDADIKTDFADDKEIANWADESVKYLKDNNISNGYVENGQTVFKPQANITRAEALVMLLRSVK